MNVSYLAPFHHSWERTKRVLFAPFRIETWVVMGFAAFLSEWLSGGFGGPNLTYNLRSHDPSVDLEHLRTFLQNPFWVAVLLWSLLALFVIAIVLQWVSSRAKFVFLDDVLRERAAIREPWSRLGRLGDSLFLFRLALMFVATALIAAVLFGAVVHVYKAFMADESDLWTLLVPLTGSIVLAGLFALAIAFVVLMLDSFVVPIMYGHGIGVLAAWARFLPVFGAHPLAFVAYAIFVFLIGLALSAAILAAGLATCCVGFVLVGLPYVSSVVLLPVHVLFRGLGPEFIAQFGAEFDLVGAMRPKPAPAAQPTPPAS